MKPALAAVALALVLPASATLAEDQKGPPAALVVVDHAVKQFVSPTALYSATVISRDDAKLAGEIAGRLTWVAEVGDRFLKGETVAKLDDTFFGSRSSKNSPSSSGNRPSSTSTPGRWNAWRNC